MDRAAACKRARTIEQDIVKTFLKHSATLEQRQSGAEGEVRKFAEHGIPWPHDAVKKTKEAALALAVAHMRATLHFCGEGAAATRALEKEKNNYRGEAGASSTLA